jgi:hypothetical protein
MKKENEIGVTTPYEVRLVEKLSVQQKEEIRRLYLEGTRKDIASYLGIPYGSVGHYLSGLGLNHRNSKAHIEKRLVVRNRKKAINVLASDSKESAYLWSLFLTDGNIYFKKSKAKHSVVGGCYRVNFSSSDNDVILIVERCFGVKRGKRVKGNWSVDIYDQDIINTVLKAGIPCRKSLKDFVFRPPFSEKYNFHFLRGLLDGDGTYRISGLKTGYLNFTICLFGGPYLIRFDPFLRMNGILYKGLKKDNLYHFTCGERTSIIILYRLLYTDSEGLRIERKFRRMKSYIDWCISGIYKHISY